MDEVDDYIAEHTDDYSVFVKTNAVLPGPEIVEWPGMTEVYEVGAQSRKRLIYPGDDNFGFAKWVHENARALVRALGEGRHYGEWWGSGINRGYGLLKGEKRFSLFNVKRYEETDFSAFGLDNVATVPVLWRGPFSLETIDALVTDLRENGSVAVLDSDGDPTYYRPEGVVVFHVAANSLFKVLCENDEIPKSLVSEEVA
jgi:hypothetical protein